MTASGAAIFIVIPVHNRCAVTIACLRHLEHAEVMAHCQVVVVDDGSTDGTKAAIQAAYPDVYPRVTVLSGDGSLWWSGAIGVGMAYAMEHGAEVILWLNDDCLPKPGAIQQLVTFVQAHPGTIAAPACYVSDRPDPVATGFWHRQRCTARPSEVVPVEGVSGYCVALPRAIVARIGYPDAKRFPQYGGDSSYLLAATRSGAQIMILGDAQVQLPDITDAIYTFATYVTHHPTPTWQHLFWQQKSPFYLPMRFHYYRDKHGPGLGTALFLLQALHWLLRWGWLRVRPKSHPVSSQ